VNSRLLSIQAGSARASAVLPFPAIFRLRSGNGLPLLHLGFRIGAAGMDDGPGAALTSPTMTHIHSFRLTRGDHPKRAAMTLRRSLLVARHHDCPKRRLIPPYTRRLRRVHHRGGIRSFGSRRIHRIVGQNGQTCDRRCPRDIRMRGILGRAVLHRPDIEGRCVAT
jgi:hypothetical protein